MSKLLYGFIFVGISEIVTRYVVGKSLLGILFNNTNKKEELKKLKVIKPKKSKKSKKKIKIGLLTNELPPIIYGGVSTWILNYLEMFKDDEDFEVIPIFLAYLDKPHESFYKRFPNIRIINNDNDLKTVFKDIDICVNNLWIALDTMKNLNKVYPNLKIVSVCHSLIKMEHLTNLGSQYTSNFLQQELTFKYSDFVVLISKAEKKYYEKFNYTKYKAVPFVIYNSYKPKFDNKEVFDNYDKDYVGYIGRHVPRKRPELPLFAVCKSGRDDVQVYNMGVDFSKNGNKYWKEISEKFKDKLNVIKFTSDKKKIEQYWKNIGVNSITGIYEPFGYTMCETLDRRVPAIVQNLDGPKEIIEEVKKNVFIYDVEKDIDKDIDSYLEALRLFWNTNPKIRKEMAYKARKALDKFRPEKIKKDWKDILFKLINNEYEKKKDNNGEDIKEKYEYESAYGYFSKLRNYLYNVINKSNDVKEIEI